MLLSTRKSNAGCRRCFRALPTSPPPEFRNEKELLARAEDPDCFYQEYCLSRKIELNLEYAARAPVFSDIILILRTLVVLVRPSAEASQQHG